MSSRQSQAEQTSPLSTAHLALETTENGWSYYMDCWMNWFLKYGGFLLNCSMCHKFKKTLHHHMLPDASETEQRMWMSHWAISSHKKKNKVEECDLLCLLMCHMAKSLLGWCCSLKAAGLEGKLNSFALIITFSFDETLCIICNTWVDKGWKEGEV